jgi:hypothetical protein
MIKTHIAHRKQVADREIPWRKSMGFKMANWLLAPVSDVLLR